MYGHGQKLSLLISRMQPWASWTKCYSQFLTPPLRDAGVAPTCVAGGKGGEISLV